MSTCDMDGCDAPAEPRSWFCTAHRGETEKRIHIVAEQMAAAGVGTYDEAKRAIEDLVGLRGGDLSLVSMEGESFGDLVVGKAFTFGPDGMPCEPTPPDPDGPEARVVSVEPNEICIEGEAHFDVPNELCEGMQRQIADWPRPARPSVVLSDDGIVSVEIPGEHPLAETLRVAGFDPVSVSPVESINSVRVTPIVNEDSGETGPRFYQVRIWSPPGDMREFGWFWDGTEDAIKYAFAEGTYCCDCNREDMFSQAVWPQDGPDDGVECGDDNWTVEVVNHRTNRVVLRRGEDYYDPRDDPAIIRVSGIEPEQRKGRFWVVPPLTELDLRYRKLERFEIADDVDKTDPAFQLWIRQTLNVRLNPDAL